jgi:hypothetical protein
VSAPPSKRTRELFASLPASVRELNPALNAVAQRALEGAPPAGRAELEQTLRDRARNARQGAVARASGQRFEDWLTAWHDRMLARDELATMEHFGPATRMVPDPGGQGVVPRIVGVAPPDFVGQTVDGRAVAIEAKSRTERLYRNDPPGKGRPKERERRGIAAHQQAYLARTARFGGIALLAVQFSGTTAGRAWVRRFVIPWAEVPWVSVRGGGPSVGAADAALVPFLVPAASLLDPRDARALPYLAPALASPSRPHPEGDLP